ncbi:MAG: tetratricopeptide repeat protein [Candidatus Aminicenantes bacterium]|nr:tetratricopeptide repeat protein [Candidatus Aminicenantes bacterium]
MTKEKDKIRKDEYEKALAAYSQAMKPFQKGDYKKAAELFRDILDKHGSERELVDRAQIYLTVCGERQSKEKVQLKTFDDYYEYGVFKINLGDYEEALKLLEKAREMKPKEGKILYLMADIYCRKGENEKCFELLKKAIQLDTYFSILARNERDFESLWEDKKFKLITRMV